MPQMGYDTKKDRLTDCHSQCDFDFALSVHLSSHQEAGVCKQCKQNYVL
jgi:hypothetical protein